MKWRFYVNNGRGLVFPTVQVIEQLGIITTRSGVLLVIDTGYLNLWSHNQKPVLPDGVLDTEEATARANSFVDLRITGHDAERAGRMLEMSWHPLYVYDQPQDYNDVRDKFEELVLQKRLKADLEVVAEQVPHRRRADLAIQQGLGAAEAVFEEGKIALRLKDRSILALD